MGQGDGASSLAGMLGVRRRRRAGHGPFDRCSQRLKRSHAQLHWAGQRAWRSPSGSNALQAEGWTPGAHRLEEGGAPGQEAVFVEVPPAWRLRQLQVPSGQPHPPAPLLQVCPGPTLHFLSCFTRKTLSQKTTHCLPPGAPATVARCPLEPQAWGPRPGLSRPVTVAS